MPYEPEYLFVYGTLRRGFQVPMQRLLARSARWLGEASVPGVLYDLGTYPGLVPARRFHDRVVGDLYRLEGAGGLLRTLDRYEGCAPHDHLPEYRRERCDVRAADGREVTAWVYVYHRPLGRARRVSGGDYLRIRPRRRRRRP